MKIAKTFRNNGRHATIKKKIPKEKLDLFLQNNSLCWTNSSFCLSSLLDVAYGTSFSVSSVHSGRTIFPMDWKVL